MLLSFLRIFKDWESECLTQKCANLSIRKLIVVVTNLFSSLKLNKFIVNFEAQILDFVIFKVNSLVIAHINNYNFIIYSLGCRSNRFKVNFRNFTYFYTFIVVCNFTSFGK